MNQRNPTPWSSLCHTDTFLFFRSVSSRAASGILILVRMAFSFPKHSFPILFKDRITTISGHENPPYPLN